MKRPQDVLYSIKSEVHIRADSYRITKFTDGNVESSYITTYSECDCLAGVRPSCRHRQMLPQMIAADIVNSSFFWNFDLGRAVDFSGTLKSNIDAMNELAVEDEDEIRVGPPESSHDLAIDLMAKDITPVGEALHSEPDPAPTPKPFVRRL